MAWLLGPLFALATAQPSGDQLFRRQPDFAAGSAPASIRSWATASNPPARAGSN